MTQRKTQLTLNQIRELAAPACERFRVKTLDVFGSVARGEFTAESDLDLLVEFEEPRDHLARRFFGFLHYFEDELRCRVDLLTVGSLRNPYLRERVLAQRRRVC